MRVMVIVKATEDTEKGVPPTAEAMAAMHAYGEAVVAAGIGMVDGAGLLNSSRGKRIAFEAAAWQPLTGHLPKRASWKLATRSGT